MLNMKQKCTILLDKTIDLLDRVTDNLKKEARTCRFNYPNIVQALAASIICLCTIIALVYGMVQYQDYKTEKRPYVSLINVEINSNLISKYPIVHSDEHGSKLVDPSIILSSDGKTQKAKEEILVTLHFKNTGPVGAEDINIVWGMIQSDQYFPDSDDPSKGKINKNSMYNDETDFKEILKYRGIKPKEEGKLNYATLVPEQESTEVFMFSPQTYLQPIKIKNLGGRRVNCLYLLCKVDYKSIGGEQYKCYSVHKLSIIPAQTKLYYALLLKSEMD